MGGRRRPCVRCFIGRYTGARSCGTGQRNGTRGARRAVRARYFLTGFGRCDMCGGSMQAVSRASSAGRNFRYVCGTYWNRGASICPNGRMVDMSVADEAVQQLLVTEVLRPAVADRALTKALKLLRAGADGPGRRETLERELATVEAELRNLAETAAKGGAVPIILEARLHGGRPTGSACRPSWRYVSPRPASSRPASYASSSGAPWTTGRGS